MKKFLYVGGSSLLLLLALLFGSLFAGPLLASAHSSTTTATTSKPTTQKQANEKDYDDPILREFTRNQKGEIVEQIAPQLHLTSSQLIEKLQSGQRIEDIAKDEGMSTANVATILINSTDTVITQALQAGKIDQKHATDLMTRVHNHPFVVARVLHRQYDTHTSVHAKVK